ncbi:unnamed protein product [Gadus morhua 'NCC']
MSSNELKGMDDDEDDIRPKNILSSKCTTGSTSTQSAVTRPCPAMPSGYRPSREGLLAGSDRTSPAANCFLDTSHQRPSRQPGLIRTQKQPSELPGDTTAARQHSAKTGGGVTSII